MTENIEGTFNDFVNRLEDFKAQHDHTIIKYGIFDDGVHKEFVCIPMELDTDMVDMSLPHDERDIKTDYLPGKPHIFDFENNEWREGRDHENLNRIINSADFRFYKDTTRYREFLKEEVAFRKTHKPFPVSDIDKEREPNV